MADSDSVVSHVIDYQRLNELYDGDTEQIASLFELFLDETFPDFQDIDTKIDQHSWPEVASQAHKLLPWVGMVGLTTLETNLRSIEAQVADGAGKEEILATWNQFKTGLNQAIPLIRQELVKLTS
ncbi:Hpt domain-containing protein [Spirosoma sp. KCTC 42546]|uniref:Hpt domain-containing protein n=1 Tax=Spirosoma sp. KCTC 42546 TaxID=2520506 RepID=UPI00115AB9AE|nr:Hpt domain-containing protein [Spirosoma sp. KCTC 42546]QDK79721.1 Hpt domain-containing protein [Spirosoma sp. KCTC 42546]